MAEEFVKLAEGRNYQRAYEVFEKDPSVIDEVTIANLNKYFAGFAAVVPIPRLTVFRDTLSKRVLGEYDWRVSMAGRRRV